MGQLLGTEAWTPCMHAPVISDQLLSINTLKSLLQFSYKPSKDIAQMAIEASTIEQNSSPSSKSEQLRSRLS